jgi:putative serine protease PepD
VSAARAPKRAPGWLALAAAALAAGLVGGLLGAQLTPEPASPASASDTTGTAVLDPVEPSARAPESVAGIATAALPSVVSISTATGSGSGFVIDDDGYLITNNHVIADSGERGVQVSLQDGRTAEATIVGTSPAYDLAVLEVDLTGIDPLALGDSDEVVVGDPVVAVGSPLGLDGTVTSGIVSATDRPVTAGGQGEVSFINAIQTDAAINPGNSGGPLLDGSGRVIGINSSIAALGTSFGEQAGSIGLGFAIPINQARLTAEQIIATGEAEYPIIGATLDVGEPGQGAIIASVVPGGPAEQVGLQPGDRVVALNGGVVRGADELIVAIRARQPGDNVTLTVARNGTEQQVDVTLGARVG